MNYKIIKISFNVNLPYIEDLYSTLSDLDKQRVSSLDVLSTFYHDKGELRMVYLIISSKDIKTYKNLLNNNLIPYFCEDLSQLVLDNDINLEIELQKWVEPENCNDYDNFIFEINKWLLKNLNLDSILDRINQKGIKTLRPIDKDFLKTI
jgi:hypothetical protein